eukprot:2649797-Pleurochrysis_carterae.AAC.1
MNKEYLLGMRRGGICVSADWPTKSLLQERENRVGVSEKIKVICSTRRHGLGKREKTGKRTAINESSKVNGS